ncbi:unnamed protein product [marine sediment metagenome]|uniref:Uncharacterized protein n=1 Tax=marine sediment metagenome TaxID=412755 RepID=X1TDZ0_9ZZZZ
MEKVTKQEWESIDQGKCPDCGGDLFVTARGGVALNVACECGSRFWVGTPIPTPFNPERISRGSAAPALLAKGG